MSAVTASLCSTLMFVLFVSADQKLITAESGQDVTLPCRAPNKNIIVVKWSRADLGDEYVLLYRDGHFAPANQHPFFKNRVDLQDRQMKDGDVSLILKDVTTADDGIYQCHVNMEGTHSWKLSSIYLIVDTPGTLGRYPVWKVALIVCMVLPGILLVGFLIYTKIQEQRKKIYKQSVRSYKYSQLSSDPPAAAPKSHSYLARRKTEDQSQKNTDYANLQTPQLNCEAVIEI